jgi:hypothetical protein
MLVTLTAEVASDAVIVPVALLLPTSPPTVPLPPPVTGPAAEDDVMAP